MTYTILYRDRFKNQLWKLEERKRRDLEFYSLFAKEEVLNAVTEELERWDGKKLTKHLNNRIEKRLQDFPVKVNPEIIPYSTGHVHMILSLRGMRGMEEETFFYVTDEFVQLQGKKLAEEFRERIEGRVKELEKFSIDEINLDVKLDKFEEKLRELGEIARDITNGDSEVSELLAEVTLAPNQVRRVIK